METYTITLSDGTMISGLGLNGNNFVSQVKLKLEDFAGKLGRVVIECSDGTSETLNNVELVQIQHYDDGWYFILRELTPDELYRQQLDIDRDMYIDLLADQEYRLCLIELGII